MSRLRTKRKPEAGPSRAGRSSLPDTARKRLIRSRLAAWYGRCRRDLPWRRRADDPYAQLLAEVMLQQTQVVTVQPYFERFIARFPTVQALAGADEGEVFALWSGLGYYSRARNLHAAARRIVEGWGGAVPRTVAELLTLPGIGRYTAGAIASIAYDMRAPVLDGNVIRVLTRLLGIEEDPRSPAVRDRLWAAAEDLLPARRCGDFNQALMELGATVCLPRSPRCADCPIRSACRAFREAAVDRIPAGGRRTKVRAVRIVSAAIARPDGALLFVQRPARGLWAGLWELPSEELRDGEDVESARRRLAKRLGGIGRIDATPAGEVTRLLTHRRLVFTVFQGRASTRARARWADRQPARWVKRDGLSELGISRACEAVLALVGA